MPRALQRLFSPCNASGDRSIRTLLAPGLLTVALVTAALAAGCTQLPTLDVPGRSAAPGPAPAYLPLDPLLEGTGDPAAASAAAAAPIESRVAALRARAAILRRPVSADGDLDRLRADLSRAR